MVTPAAKREAVAHLCTVHEVVQHRACSVINSDRTMVRDRSRRPDDQIARDRLRAVAAERRRFGYRRPSCSAQMRGYCTEPQEAETAVS